jgi:hypothetical protein
MKNVLIVIKLLSSVGFVVCVVLSVLKLAETQLNIVTYWSQGPYVLSPNNMKCINALGYAVLVHMRLLLKMK